jgi:hypothetical protein
MSVPRHTKTVELDVVVVSVTNSLTGDDNDRVSV